MYEKTKIIFRIFTLIFIIYNFYYFCLSMFIEPVLHLHIKHDIPLFKMRVVYIMPPQPGGLFSGSSGRRAYIKYEDKEILVKWWQDGWYDEYDEQEKLDKIMNSTH